MKIENRPFGVTQWEQVEETIHPGEQGHATWRTLRLKDIRVRMVDYSPGEVADHGCTKGHILLCLSGELQTELQDGRHFVLTPGVSYQVADDAEPHRSSTAVGAQLFIVDCVALKSAHKGECPRQLRVKNRAIDTFKSKLNLLYKNQQN